MSDDLIPDDALLEQISAAFDRGLPPLPERLSSAAHEAFQWRQPDVAIAELLFDSSHEELAGVRGTATERRSFRYAAGDFVVRVHMSAATMIVLVEPPLSVTCRLARGEQGDADLAEHRVTEHRTDELGELVVDAPALPVRVEVDLPGGTVATPWIIG